MATAKKKASTVKPSTAGSAKNVGKKSRTGKKAGTTAGKTGVKKAGKKGAKASPKRVKAGAKSSAKSAKIDPAALFAMGVDLTKRGFLFDAIAAFREANKAAPKNELADDALVNIGLCSLKMGMYADAIDAFTTVIEEYPEATIAQIDDGEEHGRTAAKALYGRVRAKAAIGDFAGARADADSIAPFDEAFAVEETSGDRVSFHSLANQFLASLEG